ncbi:proline-rich nuclear receptor coactivator 2-like [Agrilus planipennis]|uniref:Proline-rich nuclear receptor coactivator 2-like n=1 Tax=Agrilus planipennis TaxID=224129 RepID=A0A1W4WWN2_AGRPL|nr:proline-rich nuclear receptor coactivator 2-like [Agrilus planipennis]
MAKKNLGTYKGDYSKSRAIKHPNPAYYFNTIANNSRTNAIGVQRMSLHRYSTSDSQGSSPRTSPGLLAGHYAGCKWVEPPLPSALPPPPQHWMQKMSINCKFTKEASQPSDFTRQLKMLLNVQA